MNLRARLGIVLAGAALAIGAGGAGVALLPQADASAIKIGKTAEVIRQRLKSWLLIAPSYNDLPLDWSTQIRTGFSRVFQLDAALPPNHR